MAHQMVDVPHAPPNDEPLLKQAVEILLGVVPHMPLESQTSFLAMSRGDLSGPLSLQAPTIRTRPPRLTLVPDVLRGVVQARIAQHRYESDSAFEAKQRAATKASRTSGGIIKRYEKPQKNQAAERRTLRAVFPPVNTHTTPYGVPWKSGDVAVPGNLHGFETAAGSTETFYHWNSKDLSPSVRECPSA